MTEDQLIEQFAEQAPDSYYLGPGKGMTTEGASALQRFMEEKVANGGIG